MSTPPDLPDVTDLPAGSGLGRTSSELPGVPGSPGPLADPGTVTGGPIDDPALADRNNPRWSEPTSAASGASAGSAGSAGSADETFPQARTDLPDPQGDPLGGADMMAAEGGVAPRSAGAIEDAAGTPQDQAAQPLEGLLETGTDNIRLGRGDVQSNPALAEGGDNG